MMRKVSEIMIKDYITIDSLWGIRRIQDIAEETGVECFPVTDNGRIIGVLTRNDLIKAHPNRIALDAMSGAVKYIEHDESIWKAKEALDAKDTDMLLVTRENEVVGVITRQALNYELGKHVDLLTCLNKSDYIYYKAVELLRQGSEISIVFFDVNNFGYINKELGHAIGDKILKEIALLLKENTPDEAYLCRYGGDEFVLLIACCAEDCKAFAEKLIRTIKDHEFSQNTTVNVSAGIAGGRRRGSRKTDISKTVSDLINIASLASTRAKMETNNLVLGFCGFIDEIAI
ncbi:MAG: GGDEF domain-containing protein [Clostridiales bacterium]|jgi:diguanylate cyclase (GGDEF)-like protein|nr:GGDEF domain-containing protein [Eubacteriales bacterium]MDH7567694.1 GGDEF domain-containing protein [Clostridiales bacterium]